MQAKIGLLITHSDNYYAMKHDIPNRYEQGLKELAKQYDVEVVSYGIIKEQNEAKQARAFFEAQAVDYVLILVAAFSTGDIMMEFEGYPNPMGVWAAQDPLLEGDIQLNATVSMNLYISIAQRCFNQKKQVKWFYGEPSDDQFLQRMQTSMRALRAYHFWKNGRIGILGGVAPTFFNLENSCEFEQSQGCNFVHLTIEDLKKAMEEVDENELAKMKQVILDSANDTSKLPTASLAMGARVLSGLCHLVDVHQIDAMAASCWPDFQDHFHIVPCVPFTLLAKLKRVPVACEGDIGGAISLLLAQMISGTIPTLMDLTSIRSKEDRLLLWHCGIGSVDLQPSMGVSILPHPMLDRKNPNRELMGLAYDYAFKKGPVTMLRYSNQATLFAIQAMSSSSKEGYSGTRGYLSDFHTKQQSYHVDDVIETLMHHGMEHHLIICLGHHEEAFHEFASYCDIPWISMMNYQNTF